jgi:hypothetical protein
MSSYLLALVVSDFTCIQNITNAGNQTNGTIPIRSCGRPNAVDQLDFGLDVGVKIHEHFQNLLSVPYPLPKCGNYIYKGFH